MISKWYLIQSWFSALDYEQSSVCSLRFAPTLGPSALMAPLRSKTIKAEKMPSLLALLRAAHSIIEQWPFSLLFSYLGLSYLAKLCGQSASYHVVAESASMKAFQIKINWPRKQIEISLETNVGLLTKRELARLWQKAYYKAWEQQKGGNLKLSIQTVNLGTSTTNIGKKLLGRNVNNHSGFWPVSTICVRALFWS